ncbi:MFS-type transporter yfhI [Shouchella lehensis G1]|uniref:MFS-type transporter yfhI n=2 Tax=Shouchella lehensis TaxID=300825 RepID=A0A060LY82_9BACI|nr:MFS-type transporter yfhI [Shouchella lehensis G1]
MLRFMNNHRIVLTIFMLGTFAIGMTEYVVTGLLTEFARDLDVAVSTTGLLLSVYAISVAVFGPLLRIITIKYPPKPLLIGLTALFVISNIIAATAPTFEVLLLSRLLSATMHAPFFGLAMMMAINMSLPEKRTQAIAIVQGGLTIAIMIGVPFGSFIGGLVDWRLVFWFLVLLGTLVLIGLLLFVPNEKQTVTPHLRSELKALANKNVLWVLAIIVFGFSGVFTAYTFKEPMLREFAGFGVPGVTLGLFFFGLGAVIGNFTSGRVPPRLLTKTLMASLVALAVVLFAFTFLLQSPVLAIVSCFLFGAGTFGTTPLLNAKVILAAKEAPMLSGTIAASIFNVANALGASLGTLFLNMGYSFTMITFVAGGIILFGLVLTIITSKVEDKALYE